MITATRDRVYPRLQRCSPLRVRNGDSMEAAHCCYKSVVARAHCSGRLVVEAEK